MQGTAVSQLGNQCQWCSCHLEINYSPLLQPA
jgi:hypothetical protein